jgi:hypothetical protein
MAFFITTIFARLCLRVDILLACGKRLHNRIISLLGEVWVQKPSLICIEVSVPSQESEGVMYISVAVSIIPLSTIFLFNYGTLWYFLDI